MIKSSCTKWIVIVVVVFAAYFGLIRLASSSVSLVPSLGLAALCAVFAVLFVSTLYGFVRLRADYTAIQRAEQGQPLEDGRPEAAIGAVQPLGETLVSPLQQAACVAYAYKISHRETHTVTTGSGSDRRTSQETKDVVDYSGFARLPFAIQSRGSDIRLFGTLTLENFDDRIDQQKAAANAQNYVSTASFSKTPAAQVFAQVASIASDEGETQREDSSVSDQGLVPGQRFEEQVVTVGQQVTALGHYSATQGGFVPHLTGSVSGGMLNRLFPGDGKAARRKMLGSQLVNFGLLTVCVLASHIFLILVIFHR
jgi:hypothetical protein